MDNIQTGGEAKTETAAIIGVIATVSVFAIAQGLTYPLLSFILQRQGVSPGLIGLSAAMTPIGFIVSSPLIPWLTRRFGEGFSATARARFGTDDRLGVVRKAYDAIVSSGDATRSMIAEYSGRVIHHVGPPTEDDSLYEGLNVTRGPAEEAEVIVVTDLDTDDDTPDMYNSRVDLWLKRGLPMICTNPDKIAVVPGGSSPTRSGASHAAIAPYGPFRCRAGEQAFLGIQNEREWVSFCDKVLQQPDLARDPRFSANFKRVAEQGNLPLMPGVAFASDRTSTSVPSGMRRSPSPGTQACTVKPRSWNIAVCAARNSS